MKRSGNLGRIVPSCALAAALLGTVLDPALATPLSPQLLTGTAFQQQLAEPISISWSGAPLRAEVYGLCHAKHIAVLIDRRIDPDQQLDLALADLPLEKVLREIARRQGLGLTLLGPVVYFGPPPVTARLRTLAELRREELRGLPASLVEKLTRPKAFQWRDFATPRDLLTQLADEAGLTLSGPAQVPHDLWAAAELPPLSLIDRLTLVAGQFDLTFQLSAAARSIALVPVPDDVAIVRSYVLGKHAGAAAKKWAAMLPQAAVKVVGNKVFVRGLVEDHERIVSPPRPTPVHTAKEPASSAGEKRFTLKQAKGQLGPLLQQLATRLDLELKIDQEALDRAGISLQQPVSVSVSDATLDQLFDALLRPAGCRFRRDGKVIEVGPAN